MAETSIIIRTFNEEKHIGELLRAIKEQDYRDYEIILVDSGSTDKTLKIAKDLADEIIEIESRDFTFGYSLNIGCCQSRGKYIVIVSAHALPVNRQWLTNLLAPFRGEKMAMVCGRQIGNQETRISEKRDFERIFGNAFLKFNTISLCVNNANSAIRKELWEKHPFDENLFGFEDMEWAKFAVEKGFDVIYEPKAAIYHIHQENWSQLYNRYRREAIAARQLGFSHPLHIRPSLLWLGQNIIQDFIAALSNVSLSKLKDICHFRYTQWLGTRKGWFYDRDIELNPEKYTLYFPSANQGVVITGKGRASFQEIPLPEVKPSEVLVRVDYVGVCKTDLEVYDGTLGYYQQGIAKYPIIPGHEFSGTIVRVGANNQREWRPGERVVGECILSCGKCPSCLKGLYTACPKRREVGVMNYSGAYARFIVLPAQYLHKIPEGLDSKTACLVEPLAVVLRAIQRTANRIRQNSRCAVFGAGPIGNLCAQVLLNLGHQITIFDKNRERLEFLKGKIEVSQKSKDLKEFDLIIEATGSTGVLKDILKKSRTDATILLLGFPYGKIQYNFENLVGYEKVIIGSVGGGYQDFEEALKLLPKLETSHFTKTILPLKEFSKAWNFQRSLKHLKTILEVEKNET